MPLQSDCYTKNEKWHSVFSFMKSNPHFFMNLLPQIMHGARDDSSVERDVQARALAERNYSAEPEYAFHNDGNGLSQHLLDIRIRSGYYHR